MEDMEERIRQADDRLKKFAKLDALVAGASKQLEIQAKVCKDREVRIQTQIFDLAQRLTSSVHKQDKEDSGLGNTVQRVASDLDRVKDELKALKGIPSMLTPLIDPLQDSIAVIRAETVAVHRELVFQQEANRTLELRLQSLSKSHVPITIPPVAIVPSAPTVQKPLPTPVSVPAQRPPQPRPDPIVLPEKPAVTINVRTNRRETPTLRNRLEFRLPRVSVNTSFGTVVLDAKTVDTSHVHQHKGSLEESVRHSLGVAQMLKEHLIKESAMSQPPPEKAFLNRTALCSTIDRPAKKPSPQQRIASLTPSRNEESVAISKREQHNRKYTEALLSKLCGFEKEDG